MQEVNVAAVGTRTQWEEDHAPAYAELEGEGVRVKALADLDVDWARAMARRFGIPAAYGSLAELLAAERDLHAVVLAVPNAAHAPEAHRALDAGVNVFVEKPMAIDYPTALAMAEKAQSVGRVLWVSEQYRYMAGVPSAIVGPGGELGPVQQIRAEWLRRRGIPDRATFIRKQLSGGGAGMDLVPHLLSVVLPPLGMPQPVQVSARWWNTLGRRAHEEEFEVEDRLQGIVDFVNGVRLEIDVAWAVNMAEDERVRVTFHGPDAALDIPLLTGQPHTPGFDPGRQSGDLVLHKDFAGVAASLPVKSTGWPRPVWDCIRDQTGDFVQAVRAQVNGETESPALRRAEESLELGLLGMRILSAMYESAASGGRQVTLTD
jgi:predicted dehydrogenase